MFITDESLHMHVRDHWCFWEADHPEYVGSIKTIEVRASKVRDYNVFLIEADIKTRSGWLTTKIMVNEYGTILKSICECDYKENHPKRGCAHVVAVAHAVNELNLDFNHLPIHVDYAQFQREKERKLEALRMRMFLDQSTKDAFALSSKLEAQKLNRMFGANNDHLYLYLQSSSSGDMTRVGLKIGNGQKQYVVKNISNLVRDFMDEKDVTFGKNNVFHLSQDALNEDGKKILSFLSRFTFRYEWGRYIELHPETIDAFAKLLKEVHARYGLDFIRPVDFQFPLVLEKEEQFVRIRGNEEILAEDRFIFGKEYLYRENESEGVLEQFTFDAYGQVIQIVNSIFEDGAIYVRNEQFDAFYINTILPLESYFSIETDFALPTLDNRIHDIRVYSDMDDGMVRVWGNYQDQDTKREMFDGVSDQPVRMIEKIVEHYASQVDWDAHVAIFKTKNQSLMQFLEDGIGLIQREADVFVSEDLKRLQARKSLSLSVGTRMQNNLLEISIDSNVDKDELMSILQAYRKKKSFYKLKDGEILDLTEPSLEELDRLSEELHLKKQDFLSDAIERPAYDAFHIEGQDGVRDDGSVQAYVKNLCALKDKDEFSLPESYRSLLRPYQIQGVQWMKDLKDLSLNGILADDMGLGKTLQVLCLLDCFAQRDKPSIIVCPSSLMFNWMSEIDKFGIHMDAICVNGNQAKRSLLIEQKHELYVTTYDYLKRDIEYYESMDFEYVILDEAQYIKNPKTQNARSVKQLRSAHRLALTGTPIENSLSELWSIFDFLLPNYLYSLSYFTKNYERPIQIEEDEVQQERLRTLVVPFILRREKQDVLQDLPEKVEKEMWIDFDEEEEKLYLANLSQVNDALAQQLKMDQVDSIMILAMMTRLRQICCEPRMLFDKIKKPSTKLSVCVDLIETLRENNKKVLLFSGFTKIFDWLIEEFEARGITYHMLTGQTSKEKRKEEVDAFQEDDSDVFLISLKAGGTGLNLTSAQAVIHFDPWWNLSAQNQATDRAHRIGQTKNVLVYQLLMKNSIEEKIFEMQKRKQAISEMFVKNSTKTIASMSAEELQDLFTM